MSVKYLVCICPFLALEEEALTLYLFHHSSSVWSKMPNECLLNDSSGVRAAVMADWSFSHFPQISFYFLVATYLLAFDYTGSALSDPSDPGSLENSPPKVQGG